MEKLAVAIFGLVLVVAWVIDWLSLRAARERHRRWRGTLPGKRWWQEPPGDPPEGDY